MCGIVAAIAKRDVAEILIEGLRSLEYRGYDSAGIMCIDGPDVHLIKTAGKVQALCDKIDYDTFRGKIGIAHTRWATHGAPTTENAHPHEHEGMGLVHNGIIENFQEIKDELLSKGHTFTSETDTEVLLHLICECHKKEKDIVKAMHQALGRVRGSYAVALIDKKDPKHLYLARCGSPMVVGLGIGENFAASDVLALLPVTTRFIYLEDNEIARVGRKTVEIYDRGLKEVKRSPQKSDLDIDSITKGKYRHFMEKEIFEQDTAITDTLMGRILEDNSLSFSSIQNFDEKLFKSIEHVEIIACGTSYHAGMVGKYFLEEYAGVNTSVEIASEFRYRKSVIPKKSLVITISQSGETADTLAALRKAKEQKVKSLCICNVDGSSLVRESDYVFLTRAGVEIGVASTKAFTTQLVALLLFTMMIGAKNGHITERQLKDMVKTLKTLPKLVRHTFKLNDSIKDLAFEIAHKRHCLFLGRGTMYPIALEGALKLKEISYINAQGYAAGELKHGPIALVDENMPIVIVAPDNKLADKLASNIEEVRSRDGILYIIASENGHKFTRSDKSVKVINIPKIPYILEPVVFTIPLQLLAYHVALINGTDVDKPRNLAKSVTVE